MPLFWWCTWVTVPHGIFFLISENCGIGIQMTGRSYLSGWTHINSRTGKVKGYKNWEGNPWWRGKRTERKDGEEVLMAFPVRVTSWNSASLTLHGPDLMPHSAHAFLLKMPGADFCTMQSMTHRYRLLHVLSIVNQSFMFLHVHYNVHYLWISTNTKS